MSEGLEVKYSYEWVPGDCKDWGRIYCRTTNLEHNYGANMHFKSGFSDENKSRMDELMKYILDNVAQYKIIKD